MRILKEFYSHLRSRSEPFKAERELLDPPRPILLRVDAHRPQDGGGPETPYDLRMRLRPWPEGNIGWSSWRDEATGGEVYLTMRRDIDVSWDRKTCVMHSAAVQRPDKPRATESVTVS